MTEEQLNLILEYNEKYSKYDYNEIYDFNNRFVKAFNCNDCELIVHYKITPSSILIEGFVDEIIRSIQKGVSIEESYKSQVMLYPHTFIRNLVPEQIRLCCNKPIKNK
jgi:hypothetical protein